jgi:hypothetical protein
VPQPTKHTLNVYFLKRRQKICFNLLIKKKRITQLISKNQAKTVTTNHIQTTVKKQETLPNSLAKPTNYLNKPAQASPHHKENPT